MVPTPILMEFFIMTSSFKRGDKGKIAIELINAYQALPQNEVASKIAEALGLPQARGVAYYRWYVNKGLTLVAAPVRGEKAPRASRKAGEAKAKVAATPKKAREASSGPKASKPSPEQVQAFKDGLERARVRADLKASVDTMVLDSQVA